MTEFEKATDSITFKLNKTKQTLTGMSQNFMDTDSVKNFIDALNVVLELLQKITKVAGGTGTILGGLGAAIGSQVSSGLLMSPQSGFNLDALKSSFVNKGDQSSINQLVDLRNQMELLTKDTEAYNQVKEKFNTVLNSSSNIVQDYVKGQNGAVLSIEAMSSAVGQLTFKQLALKAATQLANSAMMMGVGLLIGAGFNLLTSAIDKAIVTQDELNDKVIESKNAYEATTSDLENVNAELKENKDRIAELEKMTPLSYTDQAELDNLRQATRELESQQKLLEAQQSSQARDLATDTLKAHSNQYGAVGSEDFDSHKQALSGLDMRLASNTNAVADNIIQYERLNAELDRLVPGTEEWAKKSAEVKDQQTHLNDIMSQLNTDMANYSPMVDIISKKEQDRWDSQEIAIMNAYEQAQDYYDMIQMATDPATYAQGQLDNIFATEGIEMTRDQLIALYREAENLDNLDLDSMYNLKNAIIQSGLAGEDSAEKIEEFKNQIEALSRVSTPTLDVEGLADGWEDTLQIFDNKADALTNLADLVDALGDSFTLTADEARKFADIYPEILANAEVTSDGLLQLNQAEVNDFIAKQQEIAYADAETQIARLEDAKAALEGLKASAEAQLELAEAAARGEVDLDKAKTDIIAERQKALTDYLIQLGLDESDAQKAVAQAMAGNMEEYNRIVGNVADNISTNMANSLSSMSSNAYSAATNAVSSLASIGQQAQKVAQQIDKMMKGETTDVSKVGVAGGGISGVVSSVKNTAGNFKAAVADVKQASMNEINNMIDSLKLDISGYTAAINSIDGQINVLKAQMAKSLDKYKSGGSGSSKSGSKGSSSSKKKDEFSETFDWLTIAIERLETQISQLDKTANNTYEKWSTRNKALSSEIDKLTDQLALETAAYNIYQAQANSVGLSSKYKKLVQNGALDISTITDEKLANKIKEYQQWYELSLDELNKIQDLQESISDAYAQRFDNIVTSYEEKINYIQKQADQIETMMDITEAKGMFQSKRYYEQLIKFENQNLKNMTKERDALITSLSEGIASGAIKEQSETWYDLMEQINDVNAAIEEANLSLIEFNNSIRDLDWEIFDYMQESISAITTESDFLKELLDNRKSFDSNGQMTDAGLAKQALSGINYNTYMSQADEYAKAMKELDSQFKNDSLNKDYLDRRRELLELQQEAILNAEKEKQAMVDLIEEGYNAQLKALQDLINTRKDAMNAEKDMYDYQKNIAEKTKNIADIRKQLAANEGDTSEESRQTIQDLRNRLKEAEQDLEDAQYEKYLKDQQAMLDDLYNNFETWINTRLDDIDGLIKESIENINANAGTIAETINQATSDVGYTLSGSMDSIINGDNGQIGKVRELVANYSDSFSTHMTAVRSTIDSIKGTVELMRRESNESAAAQLSALQSQIQKQEVASAAATKTATSGSSSTKSSTSSSTTKSTTSSTPKTTTSSSSSSSKTTTSSSSKSSLKSIFIPKKDYYPKNQLNKY